MAMPQLRRQLTLFLPEPERRRIDAVREWLDPQQYQLIAAHVTLCRETEIADWQAIRNVLSSVKVQVTLTFGKAVRLDDGCILLPVQGTTASYDRLRQAILGDSCNVHQPHITLLHPRHAQGRNDDLAMLSSELDLQHFYLRKCH